MTTGTQPPTGAQQAGSALFYAVNSVLIMFVNKWVLTTYKFPSATFLSLAQFLATLVILYTLKKRGAISFPDVDAGMFKRVFPLPIIFMLNTLTGLDGTKAISIPMFTVLRRFTMVFTMLLEYYLLNVIASVKIRLCVALMIGGALIAASSDLAFDLVGYMFIFANDIFTAAYGVVLKKKLDAKDLGEFGLMYYNSLYSLPFMAAYFLFQTEEVHKVMEFPHWGEPAFLLNFLLSAAMGCLLNYSIFMCTKFNSALTTTVVGCLKNVLSTYIGMLVGGDYVFSVTNFVGLNVSIVGSLIYSYVVYQDSQAKRAAALANKAGP
eukprot:Colp12_sorted_trinity150504_noHs@7763